MSLCFAATLLLPAFSRALLFRAVPLERRYDHLTKRRENARALFCDAPDFCAGFGWQSNIEFEVFWLNELQRKGWYYDLYVETRAAAYGPDDKVDRLNAIWWELLVAQAKEEGVDPNSADFLDNIALARRAGPGQTQMALYIVNCDWASYKKYLSKRFFTKALSFGHQSRSGTYLLGADDEDELEEEDDHSGSDAGGSDSAEDSASDAGDQVSVAAAARDTTLGMAAQGAAAPTASNDIGTRPVADESAAYAHLKPYRCIGPKHFMLYDEYKARYVEKDSPELAKFRKEHGKSPLRHECGRELRASRVIETAALREQLARANRCGAEALLVLCVRAGCT